MCGIVALLNTTGKPADLTLVRAMVGALEHRGPDDSGDFVADAIGLGFRRLSIIDLTDAGHQPMLSPDGKVALVFNGEIFNYLELRGELRQRGHVFRSSSDSEVLLHAYLEWGEACVERFNGEWAFIIYDGRRRVIFGSRDRFGIKPLYQLRAGQYVVWSSEIKALLRVPDYSAAINWAVAGAYLRDGSLDYSEETFFREIYAVPAATAFEVTLDGRERRWQYWSLPLPGADNAPADPRDSFANLLEDAVRLRLRSDVPVGVCLSGGLDSTSVICLMGALLRKNGGGSPIQAFSYHHPDYDERRYIAATLEQTGAKLQPLTLDHCKLWDLAEAVILAHDEPVHTLTAMVGFELMRMIAAAGVRVILNGQGADETLAGYDSYFRDAWYTSLRRGRPFATYRAMQAFSRAHHRPLRPIVLDLLRHTAQTEMRRAVAYRWVAHRKHRSALVRNAWVEGPLLPGAGDLPDFEPLDLDSVLHRAITRQPLPLYLRIEDRNSMAHSVETRLPFLDYRIVEMAASLDPSWKIRDEWNKFLLREAMEGHIPEIVRTRVDKMGFPSPTARLLEEPVFGVLLELITSQRARERGIYNMRVMLDELERHRGTSDQSTAHRLFRVAQFEMWARIHGL